MTHAPSRGQNEAVELIYKDLDVGPALIQQPGGSWKPRNLPLADLEIIRRLLDTRGPESFEPTVVELKRPLLTYIVITARKRDSKRIAFAYIVQEKRDGSLILSRFVPGTKIPPDSFNLQQALFSSDDFKEYLNKRRVKISRVRAFAKKSESTAAALERQRKNRETDFMHEYGLVESEAVFGIGKSNITVRVVSKSNSNQTLLTIKFKASVKKNTLETLLKQIEDYTGLERSEYDILRDNGNISDVDTKQTLKELGIKQSKKQLIIYVTDSSALDKVVRKNDVTFELQ